MGQDDQVRKSENPEVTRPDKDIRTLTKEDAETESRLVWSEIAILAFVTLLVGCYLIAIS